MPEPTPTILTFSQGEKEAAYQSLSSPIPGTDRSVLLSCGYRRCGDFEESDSPGQDFVAVESGEEIVVGVLADGVSQSFYGDIAAREVAKFLLQILWDRRRRPPEESEMQIALQELSAVVQEKVQGQAVTASPDTLLGQALARTRERGSQTVFSAFVLDARRRELILYQVGDIHTWIHDSSGAREVFPASRLGRWSSTGRSELHLSVGRYSQVAGIVLHSDGARPEWGARLSAPEVSREAFLSEAEERFAVDDVSFAAAAIQERASRPSAAGSAVPETEPVPDTPAAALERRRHASFGLAIALAALLAGLAALFFYPAKPTQAKAPGPPEVVELEPGAFYGQYNTLLPKAFYDGISGAAGEAVAQLTVYGVDFDRVEIVDTKQKDPAALVTPPLAARTFFIRLGGGGKPELEHSLILKLYRAGRPVYSGPLVLQGYHKESASGKLIGYQQVTIRSR